MMKHIFSCLVVAAFGGAFLQAQEAPKVKVEVKDVKFESQQTPQIAAPNIVDKRWKPKTWLEIDTEFDIKLPTAEGKDATFPSLEFKYYLVLNATKEGKRVMLTGAISYKEIPGHEKCHALAFVAPATLKGALQKDNGGKGDVVGWYVEVSGGGQPLAFKTMGGAGGKWWEDESKFSVVSGGVLGKDKTPFAPFWGDYDVAPIAK